MTARDEAIDAMCKAVMLNPVSPGAARYAKALDAVPAGVLARLAIERSALEQCGVSPGKTTATDVQLYRLKDQP